MIGLNRCRDAGHRSPLSGFNAGVAMDAGRRTMPQRSARTPWNTPTMTVLHRLATCDDPFLPWVHDQEHPLTASANGPWKFGYWISSEEVQLQIGAVSARRRIRGRRWCWNTTAFHTPISGTTDAHLSWSEREPIGSAGDPPPQAASGRWPTNEGHHRRHLPTPRRYRPSEGAGGRTPRGERTLRVGDVSDAGAPRRGCWPSGCSRDTDGLPGAPEGACKPTPNGTTCPGHATLVKPGKTI